MTEYHLPEFDEFQKLCEGNKMFDKLDVQEKSHLIRIASLVSFDAGEVIFYSSEASREFYIVTSGELELNLNSGKEKIYSKGDLFGEISVINDSPRMGTMTALSKCKLVKFDGNNLWSKSIIPVEMQLKLFKELANYVVGYLDDEFTFATEKVIQKGEGVTVEFKESLSKTLKRKVIEAICAFMNTRGGTILIGIKDDSTIIGLKNSTDKDIDQYKMSICQIIRDRVGTTFTSYIHFNTEKYNKEKLLRINCSPSKQPAIFEGNNNEHIFYIRSGPSNIKAPNIKELLSYYNERFKK